LVAQLTKAPFTTNVAAHGWEQETQDILYRDAQNAKEPFLALYAHTKGAAVQTEMNELWRKVMTRFTIGQWTIAISELAHNVGAVGCFWAPFDNGKLVGRAEGTQFFAGTFWWARSDVIAKIGRPDRATRFGAEGWIGRITTIDPPYEIRDIFSVPLDVDSLRPYAI
jgi:hypothetical protein